MSITEKEGKKELRLNALISSWQEFLENRDFCKATISIQRFLWYFYIDFVKSCNQFEFRYALYG